MIHKYGYKDLVHNDNQKNECPVCKPEQAIQRVRELHKPDRDGDCVHCVTIATPDGSEYLSRYPCPTIKALDGEQ